MQLTTEFILTRGVEQILPTKQGLADLMAKRKITLYQGFDPTSPSLHIGHLIGTRKQLTGLDFVDVLYEDQYRRL